jgi:crotonobetainyl-CoA:carnitine CoA-transferase CaiB-like acyl-CoA transferase
MLEPYRVLDLTSGGAMLCGQILADLGADVIAIEPPGGSPTRRIGPFAGDVAHPEGSLWWWAYARNKRSVQLDLSAEGGRERFAELAAGADFVIESFAPGHLDALGLGYAALSERNASLIMVSITPFGQDGPKAHWAANDLTIMAAAGVTALTGDPDRPPVRTTIPQAFLHAGLEGAAGALIALTARHQYGRGQHIDVSAQTAAMVATQHAILSYPWGEGQIERVAGGVQLGPIRLRFVYACKDGYVSLTFLFGSVAGPYTRRIVEWAYEEGFVDASIRDKDWVGYGAALMSGEEPMSEFERVIERISAFLLTKTKAELFAEALRRGLLLVPASTTADVLASEQLAARGFWTLVDHDERGAAYRYPGAFARFSKTPLTLRRRPPQAGEHTAEVFAERRPPAPPAATTPFPAGAQALAGLKVLDLTSVIVGPAGTRYLADHGATVVRIETGTRIDPARAYQPFKDGKPGVERGAQYVNGNCGKYNLTLDLRKPEARAVVERLVRWCDIVIENFSPKAMRGWGWHYEALREMNPGIIMLSSCLNGQDGPQAHLAGFGTMGAALTGFYDLTGWPDRAPAGPYMAYTDYIAPRHMVAALLAALDHRRRTGEGQFIDLAQAESALHALTPALLEYTVNGRVWSREGNRSREASPHGVYPVADAGRWIALACETQAQWDALCALANGQAWTEDARFATTAARLANADAMDEAVAAWTAAQPLDALEAALQRAGIPSHRVALSKDAVNDPQLVHRGHFVTLPHPELGDIVVESSRMRMSGTPSVIRWPGAVLGQHNDEVLRGILGLDDEAVAALIACGAVA